VSLTYSTYVSSLANLMVLSSPSDANFQTDLPNIIDDAELRIYRDLDLLDTSVRDSSAAMTAGNRNFTLPSTLGTMIVTDEINIITPAGTTNPDSGTRNPLTPTSNEVLNALWPSSSGSTVPQYFSMVNQNQIIVGPWPDQAYQVEVVGTVRPPSLSSTTTTTILSVFFPDLLIAASMVRAAAYQKNYGAAVDDPKMAVTWESHFQTLKSSAEVEEQRKKFAGPGWSSQGPDPIATPPRT
jgi:hypothetical protein